MDVEQAATVLDNGKYCPANDTARSSCPVCGGNPTALSIRPGKTQPIYKCHKGCDSTAVAREINRRFNGGVLRRNPTSIIRQPNTTNLESVHEAFSNGTTEIRELERHPYFYSKVSPLIQSKRLQPHSHEARLCMLKNQQVIVIPNKDQAGSCTIPIGFERIFYSSSKRFRGSKIGGFLTLGNPDPYAPTCIVEGWATGLGCLALWGYDIRVLVVFGEARLTPIYDLIAPAIERCSIIDDKQSTDRTRKRYCFSDDRDAWDVAYRKFCCD